MTKEEINAIVEWFPDDPKTLKSIMIGLYSQLVDSNFANIKLQQENEILKALVKNYIDK